MVGVYITKSNLRRIANEISHVVSTKEIEDIYRFNLCAILAVPELNVLSALKIIISSIDDPIKVISLKEQALLREKIDKKSRWVFLGGSPAYHKTNNCRHLFSEYENYNIPVQIPYEKIESYRAFFIENIDTFKRNRAAFFAMVELKFNVRIENIEEIHADNSGGDIIENRHIKPADELLSDIGIHINEMNKFKHSSDRTNNIIERLGFNTIKAINNSNAHRLDEVSLAVIKQWHELKSQLKNLIISHLIARYNPELTFNGEMLDSLGFKKCKACHLWAPM